MIQNFSGKRRRGGRHGAKISDVGALADVSVMTVSRVLNGGKVSPNTRNRVLSAIAQLGFVPNSDARGLRSQGDPVRIMFIYNESSYRYLPQILHGCISGSNLWGVKLSSRFLNDESGISSILDELRDHDGAILSPPVRDFSNLLDALEEFERPIVHIGPGSGPSHISIDIDLFEAATDLTKHLLALGHRRIGFIGGDRNQFGAELIRSGFVSAVGHAGVTPDAELIADGNLNYRTAFESAEKLLDLAPPPTAILASTDEFAIAAITAAHERGYDIPADLSICAFEDIITEGSIWPSLTTNRIPFFDMAQAAIELIVKAIVDAPSERPFTARKTFPHLLVRRQTDCAPRRRPPPDA